MNLIVLMGMEDIQICIADDVLYKELNENNDAILECDECKFHKIFYNNIEGFAYWFGANILKFNNVYYGYIY